MSNLSRFFQTLSPEDAGGRAFCLLLLVIACGGRLGFLLVSLLLGSDLQTTTYHLGLSARAQWDPSQRLLGQLDSSRKTIFVVVRVRIDRAWIQLASTDSYSLFVNDTYVGNDIFGRYQRLRIV